MVLQLVRTIFLRARNVHYCTLRAELLMSLRDLEVQEIISECQHQPIPGVAEIPGQHQRWTRAGAWRSFHDLL